MSLTTVLKQSEIKENAPRYTFGHSCNAGWADLIAEFILNQKSSDDEDYYHDHNGDTILNKK